LALAYAEAGFRTIGFDVDVARVDSLADGRSHVDDVSDEAVATALASEKLMPTTEPDALREAEAVFLCVPTPFDATKTPDLSFVRQASETIAPLLRAGAIVL